jgi:hypothetical protein
MTKSPYPLLVALLATLLGGCGHVAPWERGKLAHPTMSTAELVGPGTAHVRAVHEGAVGGGFEVGGGCGCN